MKPSLPSYYESLQAVYARQSNGPAFMRNSIFKTRWPRSRGPGCRSQKTTTPDLRMAASAVRFS